MSRRGFLWLGVGAALTGTSWLAFRAYDSGVLWSLDALLAWADVANVALSIAVSVLDIVVIWAAARQEREHRLTLAEQSLRNAVRKQWRAEIHSRHLRKPHPLRLTWRPAKDLMSSAVNKSVADWTDKSSPQQPVQGTAAPVGISPLLRLLAKVLVKTNTGTATDQVVGADTTKAGTNWTGELSDQDPARGLASAVHTHVPAQLVLLGGPGSGKSTIAAFYVSTATEAFASDPVPVLLSAAEWQPREGVVAWAARRIHEDYAISMRRARRLVEEGRVMPLLDGVDELAPSVFDAALRALNDAAEAGVRLIFTCRTDQFRRAAPDARRLSSAIILTIDPVAVDDAIEFLRAHDIEGERRWPKVTEALKSGTGPVAKALNTPLMISLARDIYQKQGDPSTLLGLPDVGAIRRHLVTQLMEMSFRSKRAKRRSGQWLGRLLGYLGAQDASRDYNLRWWHLARAIPRPVLFGIVTATICLLGAVNGLVLQLVLGGRGATLTSAALGGALIGLALGVLIGRPATRAAELVRPHGHPDVAGGPGGLPRLWERTRALILTALLDVAYAFATFSVAASVFVITARVLGQDRLYERYGVVEAIQRLPYGDARAPVMFGFFLLICLGVATATNAIGYDRAGLPRRSRPRWRDLLPSLGMGALTALLLFSVLWLAWMLIGLDEDVDPRVGVVAVLAVSAVTGVVVAAGRWLSAPAVSEEAVSPPSALRSDRTSLLAAIALTAVASGLATAAVLSVVGVQETLIRLASVTVAVDVAAIVFFGSGASWLGYSIARLWLAVRLRLPLRLLRFLALSRAGGILRQNGAAYQVRSDEVREIITRSWPAEDTLATAGRSW